MRMTNLTNSVGVDGLAGGPNNFRAVMLDTKGPEIRTGGLQVCHDTGDKKARVSLTTGDEITLVHDEKLADCGDATTLYVSYPTLAKTVSTGGVVLLDDGAVKLLVKDVKPDGAVVCSIQNDGEIGARRGVNLPGMQVELPPLSDKDKIDVRYGVQHDMDFVAASFVRKAADVENIRAYIAECQAEFFPDPAHPVPLIISKIESTEALDNLDEVIAASDGVMVARGDLGVEIPMEEVVIWQKIMVAKCNALGKPVVVATQMLETMQKNPRPTRAEVSDVTNAIIDGADAVMLSGESANGKYPVESVETMHTIIEKTEKWLEQPETVGIVKPKMNIQNTSHHGLEAAAQGAVYAANGANAACIVVLDVTGDNSRLVAKHSYRSPTPILAMCSHHKVARQLNIHRGIQPTLVPERITSVEAAAKATELGFCSQGDLVVVMDYDGNIGVFRAE